MEQRAGGGTMSRHGVMVTVKGELRQCCCAGLVVRWVASWPIAATAVGGAVARDRLCGEEQKSSVCGGCGREWRKRSGVEEFIGRWLGFGGAPIILIVRAMDRTHGTHPAGRGSDIEA